MSKGTILAIVFGILILGVIIFQTMGLRQYECEVCMELDGRSKCMTVKGESEQQAMSTAKDNACALISNGRDELIRCTQQQPIRAACKHL